ncbi:glycosyltransferase family 4 protein [Cyanobium sp. ATX 6F1]|nr:glycosyltransferase family 4 protein [Cyanobium sp. ATX 6F1]
MFPLTAFVLSACLCWLLLLRLIPFLAKRLPDTPNVRSAHQRVTPRGGGVAFVIVAGLASLLLAPWFGAAAWLPAVALPLAALGLGDDRFNLPARLRYLVQVLTAVALVVLSPLPFGLAWLEVPLLLIAITAVINFTNFMDGLDGLVAGCMAVLFTTALFSSPGLTGPIPSALLPLAALVGALLGFLLWNWSPAKVFMGDVGSTFLGAVFAGVVLQAPSWPLALGLLLVATPLLGDACLCVPRRLLAGQRVFQAHRLHLFQRLHQAGWPHARVSSLYIGATGLLAIALLLGGLAWVMSLAALELLVGLWLDQRVAVPFAVAARV